MHMVLAENWVEVVQKTFNKISTLTNSCNNLIKYRREAKEKDTQDNQSFVSAVKRLAFDVSI